VDFNEKELWNACVRMRVLHDERPDRAKVNKCVVRTYNLAGNFRHVATVNDAVTKARSVIISYGGVVSRVPV